MSVTRSVVESHTVDPPKPVRRATVMMYVLSVLFVLGYLLGAAGFVVGGLAILHDGDEQGEGLAATGVVLGVVVIAVLAALVWLTTRVRHGHGWARLWASVVMLVGLVVTALDSWHKLAADPVVIPLAGLVETALLLSALLLLWVPAPARAYFAGVRA